MYLLNDSNYFQKFNNFEILIQSGISMGKFSMCFEIVSFGATAFLKERMLVKSHLVFSWGRDCFTKRLGGGGGGGDGKHSRRIPSVGAKSWKICTLFEVQINIFVLKQRKLLLQNNSDVSEIVISHSLILV